MNDEQIDSSEPLCQILGFQLYTSASCKEKKDVEMLDWVVKSLKLSLKQNHPKR